MAKANKASQPVKAGEVPANVTPKVTFEQAMDTATVRLDALLKGGVECIIFISSAFMLGYLARATGKVKLSVMRDEFALALGKKGLGGTQTKKYLDYAFKMTGMMFKECSYGMENAALIGATTPDKAHDAVKAWLSRRTNGKKTEHGYLLTDATSRLNTLGVFLGFEDDPSKPETIVETDDETAKRVAATRKGAAKRIEKDPGILQQVPVTTLADTLSKVVSFDVLIVKHINVETKVDTLEKEMETVIAAYKARIAELRKSIGGKAKAKTRGEKVQKAA